MCPIGSTSNFLLFFWMQMWECIDSKNSDKVKEELCDT